VGVCVCGCVRVCVCVCAYAACHIPEHGQASMQVALICGWASHQLCRCACLPSLVLNLVLSKVYTQQTRLAQRSLLKPPCTHIAPDAALIAPTRRYPSQKKRNAVALGHTRCPQHHRHSGPHHTPCAGAAGQHGDECRAGRQGGRSCAGLGRGRRGGKKGHDAPAALRGGGARQVGVAGPVPLRL